MNKNTIIAVLVACAIISGAFWVTRPTKIIVQKQNNVGGANSSIVTNGNCFAVGGVNECDFVQSASTASTTCQILSPAATSTLIFASAYFTSLASTSPVEIGYSTAVATSTGAQVGVQFSGEQGVRSFATTTLVSGTMNLPVGGGIVLATTSVNSFIIPPFTYINTKIGGGASHTPGGDIGQCSAGFRQIVN